MAKLYNLAGMSTATTGTGTITLGSALYGHLTFAQAGVVDGDTVTYAINDGANSEIGRGVYTASGTTLTRTVLKSTNSNAAISLSGSASVYITPAAEDQIFVDPTNGYVAMGGVFTPSSQLHSELSASVQALFVTTTASTADGGGSGIVGCLKETPTLTDTRLGYYLFGSRLDASGSGYSAGMQGQAEAAWSGSSRPTYVTLMTTATGTTTRTKRWRVEASGTFRPEADNTYDVGSSSYRAANIYAANGTIQTSDARDKNVISRIDGDYAAAAVDSIEPVLFKWKIGGFDMLPHPTEKEDLDGEFVPKIVQVAREGRRNHAGFIAQEVKSAMDSAGIDCGVWGMDDPSNEDSRQWLRPDQMVPILWAALRATRKELEGAVTFESGEHTFIAGRAEKDRAALLITVAQTAVIRGAQAGDCRWFDSGADFAIADASGSPVRMDAVSAFAYCGALLRALV